MLWAVDLHISPHTLRYYMYVCMQMCDKLLKAVCVLFTGHGMIVEGHPSLEHWGRRLMASAPDNETEKNCSEPGMLFYEIQAALIGIF